MKEKYYCIKCEDGKYKLSDELNKFVSYIKKLEGTYKNLAMLVNHFMFNLKIKEKYHDRYCFFMYTNDNNYVMMFTKNSYRNNTNVKIYIKNLINDKYSAIILFTDTFGGYGKSINIDIKKIFSVNTKENLTGKNVIVDVNTGAGKYTVNDIFDKIIRNNVTPLNI